jgi:hypothetical protein
LQSFLSVGRRRDPIALRLKPKLKDLEVLGRVVDRQDEGRISQGSASA